MEAIIQIVIDFIELFINGLNHLVNLIKHIYKDSKKSK